MKMLTFTEFISSHENEDTSRLMLSRGKYPDIDMPLAVSTIECRKKLRSKVPSFYAETSLIYPDKLCAEQCSSEETARRKAELATEFITTPAFTKDADARLARRGNRSILSVCEDLRDRSVTQQMRFCESRIADLTGGLGVDTVAFSKIASKVLYNEAKPELAEVARHNFAALGVENIEIHSNFVISENIERETTGQAKDIFRYTNYLSTPAELLKDFQPDLIFLDPARRAEDGRKVFLLEDCQPDIIALKDELLALSRFVMVKLSPMADIDMVIKRLGSHCRLIEVISVGGECKELLALLDRDFEGECTITANCGGRLFSFTRIEEEIATASARPRNDVVSCHSEESEATKNLYINHNITNRFFGRPTGSLRMTQDVMPDTPLTLVLLEPDKALMKTAPFRLLEQHFGIEQLDRDTHYYITDSSDFEKFAGYFKIFEILRAEPLNKRTIKAMASEFPEAEVTARNIPMTSDELRKRLGTKPSDEYHIFGLKYRSQNSLFACRKCSP